ncbi:hypothetical protein H696_04275 [Fonticula alba]|uniref:sphingolipid 4-desaturase n=1 Tax=Fonticula alba TaxID=691883 RepID=A0A058Z5R0_FONAL|nr:hypothetical protein H696_04275 [Fonticula alba]KCV68857.1 hypothetical protein H696_04275 [Fonticula alba]|eukprot:XP_009496428.1 hypothetical protein H696_04275 [Fonticula alba]
MSTATKRGTSAQATSATEAGSAARTEGPNSSRYLLFSDKSDKVPVLAKEPLDDFILSYQEEPHMSRRMAMLKKYPEIKQLFGYTHLTGIICTALVILQVGLSLFLSQSAHFFSWYYFVIAYVVGATANHALLLGIHELAHSMGYRGIKYNRLMAMIANIPILIPYSTAFKDYHLKHHRYQGVPGVDVDLPTRLETKIFWHWSTKLLFCVFQIFFYAIRPMFIRPFDRDSWLVLNWAIQMTFNVGLYTLFGWRPFFYMLLSTFLAGSLHPTAGHFIAEHYSFDGENETYSYYGPLNAVTFNVGYHMEHHDFPNIPWTNLPKLRKIAPEFYNNLPYHMSWTKVLINFIFDDRVTVFNRIVREAPEVATTTLGAPPLVHSKFDPALRVTAAQ